MKSTVDYYNKTANEWAESGYSNAPDVPSMFEFAKNKIKQTGAKQFFVSCNKFNHNAQKFYEKMGGKIIHIDEDNEDKSLPQITFLYEI